MRERKIAPEAQSTIDDNQYFIDLYEETGFVFIEEAAI
jgi:hypothetical protein